MKVIHVIRLLEKDGWYLVKSRGGHRQFKHAYKKGRVTVPGAMSDDLPAGTLHSISKQAGVRLKP